MTDMTAINHYVKTLSRHLSALPTDQRNSITAEIRVHLETRAAEGRLKATLESLGTPEECAQLYLEELSVGSAKQGPLFASKNPNLLIKAKEIISTASGFMLMGWLYLFSAIFIFLIGAEFFYPSHTGLWLGDKLFLWGIVSDTQYDNAHDIVGFWFIPLNVIFGLIFFQFAKRIGQLSKQRVM